MDGVATSGPRGGVRSRSVSILEGGMEGVYDDGGNGMSSG